MPAKRTLAPEEYERIRSLAAKGASHRTIARALGVCTPTWKAIRRRDPHALAALRSGRRDFCTPLLSVIDMFEPLPGKW